MLLRQEGFGQLFVMKLYYILMAELMGLVVMVKWILKDESRNVISN